MGPILLCGLAWAAFGGDFPAPAQQGQFVITVGTAKEPKPLQFNCVVFEAKAGDEKDPAKREVLSSPTITTWENQAARVLIAEVVNLQIANGQNEYIDKGVQVLVSPGWLIDDKVRVDLTLTVVSCPEVSKAEAQVHTNTVRSITEAQVGHLQRFRGHSTSNGKHVWIEYVVTTAK